MMRYENKPRVRGSFAGIYVDFEGQYPLKKILTILERFNVFTSPRPVF